MHLNQFTNYALRILMYCALVEDRVARTSEIAHAHGISENHLTKVAQQLAAGGFLATHRGRGGGLRLAMAPASIIVGDVVRCAEGTLKLAECFDPATNTCRLAPACRLRHALHRARDAFFLVLDGYTLADLVVEPHALTTLLGMTPQPQAGETYDATPINARSFVTARSGASP